MMEETVAGRWFGLAFGSVGLAVAFVLVVAMGVAGEVAIEAPLGLVSGVVATLVVSRSLGGVLAARLGRGSLLNAVVLGTGVGILALQAGVLAGTLPQLVTQASVQRYGIGREFYDYVVKPLAWINFFGLVPAAVLGAVFGVTVARVVTREGL